MIMNQLTGALENEPVSRLGRRIRHVLEKRQAMNLSEICRALVLDPGPVSESLDGLVGAGEVERLRPVAYQAEDCDFFRLRRLSDQDFLWEQRYLEVGSQGEAYACDFIREAHRWMDRRVL